MRCMPALPDPLHPAIVHFPIAFLIAGAVVAVLAIFVRRWHLPWLAAIILVAGALGSVAALITGEEEEHKVEPLAAAADHILEEHEEWGETTRNLALLAALLAVAAAFTVRQPIVGRGLSIVTAVIALAAVYAVAEAGHYGGELVYRHGVGVNSSVTTPDTPPQQRTRDDD